MEEKPADAASLIAAGTASSASKSTRPKLPDKFNKLLTKPRLKAVKQYIGSFQYRLSAQTNFNAHKLRPLSRIMDTARMIIYAPQPIKCVEAVFLALYLTAGLPDVERVPLGFKTQLNGQVYQHIVLLVQHGGKYGAFGISRCPDLMNKDLVFGSMSSIIENFKSAYETQQHVVQKIRVGLPVEHNIVSPNFVCWRHLNLNLQYQSWSQCIEEIEKHASKGSRLWDLWILSGKGEDPHKKSVTRKAPLDNKFSGYDSAKKKKLIASREPSPLKAKSVMYTERTSVLAESSSSRVCSECYPDAETSGLRKCLESNAVAEPSGLNQCLESNVVAPFPTTIGNSRFRRTKKATGSGSVKSVEPVRGEKLMRAVLRTLPRSARSFDQTLAVKRSFLGTKCFKGASTSSAKTATHGPKMSARRKMVIIGRNTLLARLPAHVSFQTLDGEALFPRAPKRSVAG